MFNNDSNTSLVMVGGPYPYPYPYHPQQGLNNKSAAMSPSYNQLVDPRLAPHPQPGYYLHHQRTIEIIQLEEVPPPSKRERISVPGSSSWASTSYASSSVCTSEEEEEEEEEAASESYCSSEEEEQQLKEEVEEDDEEDDAEAEGGAESRPRSRRGSSAAAAADSYSARMRRIEQWRDAYAKAVGAQLAPSPCRTTKRKVSGDDEDASDDDNFSHSSKRSRHGHHAHSSAPAGADTPGASIAATGSAPPSYSSSWSAASVRSVSVHSCSACDAWFPDRGSLHKHGFSPRTNEACRAAVEYDFEEQ